MTAPARVVIIGNGMAGARVAQELRRRDPALSLTVLGAERCASYNRVLLTDVLAGAIDEDEIYDRPADQRGARVHTGVSAVAVDRERRTVLTADGGSHPYDSLVLATGSTPRIPEVPGLRDADGELGQGVAAFRTLDDCHRILSLAGPGSRALVLGGGLLGLEAARALAGRQLDVQVLHSGPAVLNRQLNAEAAGILTRQLAELGVTVVQDAVTVRLVRSADGRLTGAELADGRVLPGTLLVVACGVEAESGLAAAAGLPVADGIVVDERMRTADPAVYAIGDCARQGGRAARLVDDAWAHARIAADAITGAQGGPVLPPPAVTRLKAEDIDLTLIGEPEPAGGGQEAGEPGAVEVLTDTDQAAGRYQRIVLRGGRITGAALLGGHPDTGLLIKACADRRVLTEAERGRLARLPGPRGELAPDSPEPEAEPPVCYCRNVSERRIREACGAGARTVAAIARTTRATTGCGICRSKVKQLLKSAG
ncbi:FAD-dependent oxidoreductase [Streptomyces bambusae]|uniref:FAD-dependent oxidoreductase n=1 Tax=Streptomyces bambusae TaxID=1550616 RepID=UPI001CFD0E0C|nr:FAD-dependent oxidoreductase [Streptomyces bambusae]MCB5165100.1 FAD-dependent oxidoreductase [Streptomyces bambusae]